MYEKNVLATLRLTQALLPGMRENGGDVVFVTSTAAHETYAGGGGYTAAKHAELDDSAHPFASNWWASPCASSR